MRVNTVLLTAFFITLCAGGQAFGQLPFSIGVKGGVGLTDAFSDQLITGVNTQTHNFSSSKDYVVGPMIELRLPMHLSVEFDALYRPLHLTVSNFIASGTGTTITVNGTANSWEFPILGKYHFLGGPIKPYIEAGPSFRSVRQFALGTPQLSSAGFTAGGGIEVGVLKLKVAPELRYTRWAGDSNSSAFGVPVSNVNQAEFLVGISF